MMPYTGMLSTFGSHRATVPSDWIVPWAYGPYPVPQPVYVPVPVPAERPALEPMQVVIVRLRAGAALPEVRLKPHTVVSWVNEENRDRTVVVELVPPPGGGAWSSRQSGVTQTNASVSLAFHQPGVYEYYLQDQPDRRARVTVGE
jgi:plastocyanin